MPEETKPVVGVVSPRRSWVRHVVPLVFFAVMAVAHTWPLASAPGALSRHDNGDALLNEWAVAWVEHQLPRDPLHLFDANIFYPERNTLAFSEHLFVQGVLGLPLHWAGLSTTAVHNLLVIIGLALTGWATYLVMMRWTGDTLASILSGCLMAFNAHTLTRLAHLQAMHVEFLPPAVLALDELLERPRIGAAVALAVFFALQGLTSNYLMVFTVFALAAAVIVRPEAWWGRRVRTLAWPFLLSAGLALLLMGPFLLPYYWAYRDLGFHRTAGEIAMYSATWRDYVSTGGRVHFDTWAKAFWSGTALFPGVTAAVLTLVTFLTGLAFRDRRARMWAAIGVAGVLLSLGSKLPGYEALSAIVPLLQGIRAPVRFGFLMLAGMAVLGGFGVRWLRQRCGARTRLATAIGVAAVVLVTVEAFRAPLWYSPALAVSPMYGALAREPNAVVVEYPLGDPMAAFNNAPYMLNSTRHWRPMVNGYSGFVPNSYRQTFARISRFPEPGALRALVDLGVTHVVLHDAVLIAAAERTPAVTLVVSDGKLAIYRLSWTRIRDLR